MHLIGESSDWIEWQKHFFGVDDECEYRELMKLLSGEEPHEDVSGEQENALSLTRCA